LSAQDPTTLRFTLDGVARDARFVREGDRLWLQHCGRSLAVVDRTRAAPSSADAAGGDGIVRASMTGRVVAVVAAAGERVAAGRTLVVLEAMKMEHVQAAPREGAVETVHVVVGAQVAAGQVLVTLG
jgi:geranyl-CoA carboxylase alpha subunit